MTEVDRDELRARIEKFGLTEQEARVSIYLDEGEKLLTELERQDEPQQHSLGHLIWRETHVREQFRALQGTSPSACCVETTPMVGGTGGPQ